ncbi:hypothetical protein [Planococcus sp. ISL-110]|uniref:hypothetical protein n=1 Tax=Planococcus sp. ISL-110 TaxID=2819167 RepID=UPI001BEBB8D4|nr:hypothetical protein [Planococcus sp. ISL-110]MBT2571132.1 hypothetical protein [Planococcus sp. ISL-110]
MIRNKWVKIGAVGILSTSILAGCGEDEALDNAEPAEVLEAEDEADQLEEETDIDEEQADELEEETDTAEEQADELEEETDEAAEEVLDEIDMGNINMEELETTYLTPLGWTVIEFDNYVEEEYGVVIADFDDFSDLETTVGPVEDIEVTE